MFAKDQLALREQNNTWEIHKISHMVAMTNIQRTLITIYVYQYNQRLL